MKRTQRNVVVRIMAGWVVGGESARSYVMGSKSFGGIVGDDGDGLKETGIM